MTHHYIVNARTEGPTRKSPVTHFECEHEVRLQEDERREARTGVRRTFEGRYRQQQNYG